MTIHTMCEQIAAELNKRGLVLRNKVTGMEVRTAEDGRVQLRFAWRVVPHLDLVRSAVS
jgi:hypothetical protein